MMNKFTIYGFTNKTQYRIKFVSFLKEFGELGLKNAKNLQDSMIEGIPIELNIVDNKVDSCREILEDLKMNYVIEPD